MGEFDSLYPGHFILEMDTSIVQEMLDACNAVIADPDRYDETYVSPFGTENRIKKLKGLGTLSYTNSSI